MSFARYHMANFINVLAKSKFYCHWHYSPLIITFCDQFWIDSPLGNRSFARYHVVQFMLLLSLRKEYFKHGVKLSFPDMNVLVGGILTFSC